MSQNTIKIFCYNLNTEKEHNLVILLLNSGDDNITTLLIIDGYLVKLDILENSKYIHTLKHSVSIIIKL